MLPRVMDSEAKLLWGNIIDEGALISGASVLFTVTVITPIVFLEDY